MRLFKPVAEYRAPDNGAELWVKRLPLFGGGHEEVKEEFGIPSGGKLELNYGNLKVMNSAGDVVAYYGSVTSYEVGE